MKNISLHFIIFILFILSINKITAQIGIHTNTPTATLDVVSQNSNTSGKVLKASNSSNQMLIDVNLSGDLTFGKAIMPAKKPGNAGEYLISQGPDTAPVWGNLPKGATVQIFNAQRDSNSTTTNAISSYVPISFPTINSSIDPAYGTWNSTSNKFTVAKKGIYTITAGFTSYDVKCDMSNSIDWEVYAPFIFLETSDEYAANGVTTLIYNSSYSAYITKSTVLEANSIIQVLANSNACSWKQGPSFISILYSEIP
ncbi:hypothetical protein [Chryseobacterium oryctis]|uniref:C1q domain-containing protein n=1 Tax=Chryseobacterium oryctis TaxID=2952618 RepID=A0ABT3HRN2_9FLAO|nr:hypothetical protein [Chryseobacterium oryctis]MCW3162438.1 hypothetical protein [Chryseobacterium oryctis]